MIVEVNDKEYELLKHCLSYTKNNYRELEIEINNFKKKLLIAKDNERRKQIAIQELEGMKNK